MSLKFRLLIQNNLKLKADLIINIDRKTMQVDRETKNPFTYNASEVNV